MRTLAFPAALIGTLLLGAAGAQPPPLPDISEPAPEEFVVARDGAPILVPVTIRGKTYPFVLDTGSSKTVYDKSLRPLLGAPQGQVKVQTPGGEISLEQFAAPEAFFGKLPLPRDTSVVLCDLRPHRELTGEDWRGILGMDFLKSHVIAIDFDQGTVSFRRHLGDPLMLGQSLLMSAHDNIPYLLLDVVGDGQLHPFKIDTGHVGSIAGDIARDLFRALLKAGKVREFAPGGFAYHASGKYYAPEARLTAFSVGPFNHRNLLFSSAPSDSRLGLTYWSRYAVTFDFPGSMLYLKPGAGFNRRDEHDRSGLQFVRRNGATVITEVGTDSPAARAGIKPRDILLSVAGTPVDQRSLIPARRLLSREGRTAAVRFKRGEAEREVSLTLVGGQSLSASDFDAGLAEMESQAAAGQSVPKKDSEAGLVISFGINYCNPCSILTCSLRIPRQSPGRLTPAPPRSQTAGIQP
jgi:hypothetical protein